MHRNYSYQGNDELHFKQLSVLQEMIFYGWYAHSVHLWPPVSELEKQKEGDAVKGEKFNHFLKPQQARVNLL